MLISNVSFSNTRLSLRTSILFFFFFLIGSQFALSQISAKHKEYLVRSLANKCLSYSSMLPRVGNQHTFDPNDSERVIEDVGSMISFFGFGFSRDSPQYEIEQVEHIAVKPDLELFAVIFEREAAKNIELYRWTSYFDQASYSCKSGMIKQFANNRILVGYVKETHEVIPISGVFFEVGVQAFFDLDRDEPESYIPFLKTKLYSENHNNISVERVVLDSIFFLAQKQALDGARITHRYVLDVNAPDTSLKKVNTVEVVANEPRRFVNVFPKQVEVLAFQNDSDKEKYVLDALMRNLFAYQISSIKDLPRLLQNQSVSRGTYQELAELLPNYDEFYEFMGFVKYPKSWSKNASSYYARPADHYYYPIPFAASTVSGYKRYQEDVEFYRIFKSEIDVLRRAENIYSESLKFEDWDVSNLHWRRIHRPDKDTTVDTNNEIAYLPKPPRIDFLKDPAWTYETTTRPESIIESYPGKFDFYLLALNTSTREVYFISGSDIFLSHSTDLYRWGDEDMPFRSWPLEHQLDYLQDRLYRYQIEYPLVEDDITSINEDGMELSLIGSLDGKPIPITVSLNFKDPENVEVLLE